MNKRYLPYFILALFAVPFFFLGFQDTHVYGDDWAQYVREALNIAHGKPYYQSGYMLNPANTDYAPPQYPPGFPLLLAPVVARSGLALWPMQMLTTLCLAAALFAAYYYYRGKMGRVAAVCLSLILLYGSYTTELKSQILSDLPCMFFVLLYLGLRERQTHLSRGRLVLLSCLGAFIVLIRTQMLLLVVAEIIVFLYGLRRIDRQRPAMKQVLTMPAFWLPIGIGSLFFLVNNILFPVPAGNAGFYASTYKAAFAKNSAWDFIGDNAMYLLDLWKNIFYHNSRDAFGRVLVKLMTYGAVTFALLGAVRQLRREWNVSLLFLLLMSLLMLVTPMHQGIRYFVPAAPVFIWLTAEGIAASWPAALGWKPKWIAVGCTLLFLALGYDDHESRRRADTHWSLNALDTSAYTYVREHVPDSTIVLFSKPRLLNLFTDKRTMILSWNVSLEENRRFMDSVGAGYLLFSQSMSDPFNKEYVHLPGLMADSVVINSDFVLYRLKKAGG